MSYFFCFGVSVCGQLSSEEHHGEGRRETRSSGDVPRIAANSVLVSNAVGIEKLISDDCVAWGAMNDRNCQLLTRYCLTAVTLGPGAFRAQKY